MKSVCATGGTGYPFFDFSVNQPSESHNEETSVTITDTNESSPSAMIARKIEVGCKTGTAESHAKSGMPHAWFTVFAPYENPEIVLTVLVEEGGQGSEVAAPLAKEILKVYFERYE